jgi:hypothetical protein
MTSALRPIGWPAILGIALACLVGCTSAHHSAPSRPAHRPTNTMPAPRRSPTTQALPAWYTQCQARKVPGTHVVPFRGTQTTTHYCAIVWSADVVHDCRRLAYGTAVIAFVRRHPCGPVRRVLATVYVGGFSVNVSSVVTSFAGTQHNPYGAEYTFGRLASSRRSGGIADLLRNGHRIPGPHGTPPADAHYELVPFNTQVDILYTWYRTPPASHVSWKLLDQDLSFSRLTG